MNVSRRKTLNHCKKNKVKILLTVRNFMNKSPNEINNLKNNILNKNSLSDKNMNHVI